MKLIELVPRDLDEVISTAKRVLSRWQFLDGVNIPDIVRLPNRSDMVAIRLADAGIHVVPHIRCIDRHADDTIALIQTLVAHGVSTILLVSGDRPQNNQATWDVSPLDLIPMIKNNVPNVTVNVALDPYRSNLQSEMDYCRKKRAAGANGFFSQPFFDIDYARYFMKAFESQSLFVGVSPVTTDTAKSYWETVNRVPFATQFNLDIAANAQFAADMCRVADDLDQHVYLMPIKIDLYSYLGLIETHLTVRADNHGVPLR